MTMSGRLAAWASLGGLVLSTHCAPQAKTVANVTIGNTGCPSDDLAIFNYDRETRAWQAACHEKIYVCSDIRGATRCTLQDEDTRDPEVFVRSQLLFELPKTQRNVFIDYPILEGSWDVFSMRVAAAKRFTEEQAEELQGKMHLLYADVSAEFNETLSKCMGPGGTLGIRVDEARLFDTATVLRSCSKSLLASKDLEPLKQHDGQQFVIVAGVFGVKPIPRPEPATEEVATKSDEVEEESSPAKEVDLALGEAVRAWLEENSADILTCTDSKRSAVLVKLDDTGAATASLRGDKSGGPEEECIRAALGEKSFEGQSVEILHLVKSAEPSE